LYKRSTRITISTVGCLLFSSSLAIDNFSDLAYREHHSRSFLDPSRLAVPKYVHHSIEEFVPQPISRYQNYFRITVWLFFLAVYSIAGAFMPISTSTTVSKPRPQQVQEPLDKIDPNNQHIDAWEVILYVLALSFSLESESFVLLPRYAL
jgi:hypothetical protein